MMMLRVSVINQPSDVSRSRAPPRLLCTATQQKNGPGSEEEAEKPEQTSADRVLLEEKSQLETQLKDLTVRRRPGPKQSRRAHSGSLGF